MTFSGLSHRLRTFPALIFAPMTLLVAFLLMAGLSARSQSIVGAWKRTSSHLENSDGSSKDMQKMLTKSRPCMADIQYVFGADGRQLTRPPKDCELPGMDDIADYKVSGNTITLTSRGNKGPLGATATYTLAFKGNTVIFSHVYTENEKATLHTKAARLIMIYTRV
jgi:hypothetical protein